MSSVVQVERHPVILLPSLSTVLVPAVFMSQDVQTVGANNLLRNLISHTNLISYTLFKCVLFKEDSAPSMPQPKHPPLPFKLRNPGS